MNFYWEHITSRLTEFWKFSWKIWYVFSVFTPAAWKLSTMASCQNLRTTGFSTLKTKLNRSVSLSIHLEFHLHFHIYWMGSLRTLSRPWIFVPGVCNSYVRATNKKGEIGYKSNKNNHLSICWMLFLENKLCKKCKLLAQILIVIFNRSRI